MTVTGQLDCDAIIELARRESGAHAWHDEALFARVAALVGWINARGPYESHDLRAMRQQVQRTLVARLRIALDRANIPAIADERIERPVFIIGFPRSGTTLLHSLLAEDPEAPSLRSWHVYSPSPPPGAGPIAAERIAMSQRLVEAWMDFCPAQKMMHPYVDKGAFQTIEDEEAFTLDFRNAYPFHYYRVPTLDPGAVMLSTDQVAAFRWHRELLQHLQWNTGKSAWVCKGPSHQMNLAALLEVYPDALCVWAHRPIGEIWASNVAIRAATYDTIAGHPQDWTAQAKTHVTAMKAAIDRLLADKLLDDPRVLHLSFREIAADPLSAVRKVCEKQGRALSPGFAQAAASWLADPENASDRFGRYPYSYEAFGLDRGWVEDLFADYSRRFGL
ncbi:MAG: sulfotransferase [Sphingomonadales bacterium]|nr:sulfotransferase [Sphingomonadales bacterium]